MYIYTGVCSTTAGECSFSVGVRSHVNVAAWHFQEFKDRHKEKALRYSSQKTLEQSNVNGSEEHVVCDPKIILLHLIGHFVFSFTCNTNECETVEHI